ncbi:hypothetical protein GUJ93_ZPchr0004g39750 [Zizania palustris]|uniref:Uncharacterized protein n=1 Tax=Zizania palustris TaxID=103762 RepID=A0A8J5VFB9_ZIZPA|nr:hypothetical protein GUJ93_ZPchr0004g39750 [Zizania palustris]
MDDFTFPTAAAAADTEEPLRLHHHHHLSRHSLPFPHFTASPLWFPSSCPVAAAAPVAVASKDVVQVVMAADDDDGEEEGREPTSVDAGSRREEERAEATEFFRGGAGGGGAAAADDEEKMDLLWEDFNEELAAVQGHRVGSFPRSEAVARAAGLELSESDTESEPPPGHGCAPMLLASSRAGATGHYRRTSSWLLLMKIFKRLFVIEKTISSSSRHFRPR